MQRILDDRRGGRYPSPARYREWALAGRAGRSFSSHERAPLGLLRGLGRGMGCNPMETWPEGYPKAQAKAPARPGLGVEQGAGVPVGSVAANPEGRSGAARVLANGGLGLGAPRKGRGLHFPALVTSTWPALSQNAATLFFIARNEGSSMVPDDYSCIHRMNYE
jgi:hypothetical protein